MKPNQKKLTWIVLWGMTVLGMIALVGTGVLAHRQLGGDSQTLDILWDAPSFSLTDQNGKKVTDADLRGNVWVATVFFSQCPGVCPMMSARMAQLQKSVKLPDVKIVEFSIDPEHDTPAILKEYASKLGADESRWMFLTGEKQGMFDLAVNGFKLQAAPASEGQPIIHTQKVLLIDRMNRVRGYYDTNDDDAMKKLATDAQQLARQ
ncbi:MAG TPA: SCO family protein [Tepidisphaeraceae bacterium]|nr:SCO family protein [Tepidisphaeraceae bacterium]